MKRYAESWPQRRLHKKSRVKRPCFLCRLNTPYLNSLSHRPGRGSPSFLTVESCWLDESAAPAYSHSARLELTSSQDLDLVQSQRVTRRSLPVPNPHHVV